MSPKSQMSGRFVLLVNARPDKGFDFILEVAAKLPEIPFLAVASQSPVEDAIASATAAGVQNIRIIPKVSDVEELYSLAHVVLVPSFAFVETFSRVCIEAHRRGLPVIGSNVGNVPNLLRHSGVSLPEDADAWAKEIAKLYVDPSYYAQRRRGALENSARYSQEGQFQALKSVVESSRETMLIGVGAGIGNMLHVTPTIRNIAVRGGRKVDLVIAEDHADSLFLLHNSAFVNAVYSLAGGVRKKRYDTVFITNSFGPSPVTFCTDRLIRSRDWDKFRPGETSHETIFNLESAQHLLGIDFSEADTFGHYVGDLVYTPNNSKLVGFHGGSKGGYWSSKRWGGFEGLSRALIARGYRVASYGTPDEYIPGTEDRTGGSIQEMAESLLECQYMVSNDSGVMNIAAALGIPTLAIFGPTDPATRRPLAHRHHFVAHTRSSRPCEVVAADAFRAGLCKCIDGLSVDDVLNGFEELVAKQ